MLSGFKQMLVKGSWLAGALTGMLSVGAGRTSATRRCAGSGSNQQRCSSLQ